MEECVERAGHRCEPLAPIPAWWSGFLFHILNPRQVCIYTYLTMLSGDDGECSPTIEQIREDLGLYSSSKVFEALTVLEDLSLIKRERRAFEGSRAKRNVYRRPPCEVTVLRLLELERIDASMRPRHRSAAPASDEAKALVAEGMRLMLGDEGFARYEAAAPAAKLAVLEEVLTRRVGRARTSASED